MADELSPEKQEIGTSQNFSIGESTINAMKEGIQESDTMPEKPSLIEDKTSEDSAQDNILDGANQKDEQTTKTEAPKSEKVLKDNVEKEDTVRSSEDVTGDSAVLAGEESGAEANEESSCPEKQSTGDLSIYKAEKCEATVSGPAAPAVTDVSDRSIEEQTQPHARDHPDEVDASKPAASSTKDCITATEGRVQEDQKSELQHSRTRPKSYGRATRKDITEKFGGVATSGVLVKRSTSCGAGAVKNMLLEWCRAKTRGREGVDIQNFSSSWSSGLAFCALILAFFPDAFDYDSLDPKNRKENFQLAFNAAESMHSTTKRCRT
ncbi:smoothelin-like protein 1 isoform 2-T4 [Anomaloglossus baeobatrachus]|uniref:smoothelin-like protein 1 isoform X2 n=1 Tax=Anomaloglossus baeobatrachus TaxID=238106 RepID=UPI003F4F4CDA